MYRKYMFTLTFLIVMLICFTYTTTYYYLTAYNLVWLILSLSGVSITIYFMFRLHKRNAQKIAFMFDAIDNNDYAFKFPTHVYSRSDKMVNVSLNRIKDMLQTAKENVIEKEKYYELIINSVNTGVIVINDKGYIYQTNNEALRLLGLSVFTHVKQLGQLDEALPGLIGNITPGSKLQTSFTNERDTVNLSIRASIITIQGDRLRLITLNDINSELDEKEIDSWIRLIRVLTHEIMNSITPISSISDTLLELHHDAKPEILNGLKVISTTGKGLIAFVDSYREFTRIPTPQPELFYVEKFVSRIVKLARHHDNYPNISILIEVEPVNLIVYADENLISQVLFNLLKNAMQAIGNMPNGAIKVKAYSNSNEEVVIEVSNNGPVIPANIAEHIFVPFFTTKEGGSGIGLSISRQIMRLSGAVFP